MARVGMVVSRCQPEIGGIESHVAEVAGRIVERGHDLEILTTDRSGRLPRVEDVRAGSSSYRIRRFRAYPADRDWYLSPGLFLAALRQRADLVHVQGIHTLVPPLAMIAAILRRRRFLLTFHTGGHSSAFRERSRGLQWRLLAPLLRRARALVGVSDYEARRFEAVLRAPRGTIRTIRNGGSLPALVSAVAPEAALVVSSGRLERYKGHHRAVEALPHLLAELPGARVEILGSGPYEAELRALAERLGVAERVSIRFVPPPDRAEMARSLARAGVVVLLSDYEAHPVSVMEALTAGRPVVVSRGSGLTEVEEMGYAVGVERDAPPAVVAAAILRQARDPLPVPTRDLPTWETCVDALVATYDEVLGSARDTAPAAGAR